MAAKRKPAPKSKSRSVPRKSRKIDSKVITLQDIIDLDNMVDDIEKDFGLVSVTGQTSKRQSTSLLSLDLILDGGLVPGGWYTFFGGEQSSKSTLAMTEIAKAAIDALCPIIQYWDFEGSFSPDYFMSIARSLGFTGTLQDMFGIQDPNTGKYIKRPMVRRYQQSVAEDFFDAMKKIAKTLPDKLHREGKWYLVFEANKKDPKDAARRKMCNEKLFKKTGKYWIETDNGNPQAIFVVDSYPAMLPRDADEKEEESGGLAEQARMFSKQIKRVKGKMANKKIIIMGVNQLRDVPMAMFGPKEQQPGGNALKFYSDARLKMTSRSSVFGNKGLMEKEPSVNYKGRDKYRYVRVTTDKNKLSIPDLKTWIRIWVKDPKGQAHGFDPVFDSFYFMKQTSLLTSTETKKQIKLTLEPLGIKGWPPKKSLDWLEFKTLILGDKEQITKLMKKLGYKGKPFLLRRKLEKFMLSGKAKEAFLNYLTGDDTDD